MKVVNKENELLCIQPIENDIKLIKDADYIVLNKEDLTKLYQMNCEGMDIAIGNLLALVSKVN